ncbi:hypothetical protein CRV24_009492 [Beauveria bassiana]|nr:hypothetical protein CRV24_009492 [Beauveria bassiana]KAH8707761.1 hypothetical protein HC256_009931 [Beauveria bassiana]
MAAPPPPGIYARLTPVYLGRAAAASRALVECSAATGEGGCAIQPAPTARALLTGLVRTALERFAGIPAAFPLVAGTATNSIV